MAESLRMQSRMAEESWQQEHETAGHNVFMIRKHRVINADVQLAFFTQFRTPAHGMVLLKFRFFHF